MGRWKARWSTSIQVQRQPDLWEWFRLPSLGLLLPFWSDWWAEPLLGAAGLLQIFWTFCLRFTCCQVQYCRAQRSEGMTCAMDRECWDPSESFIVSCVLCTSSLDWGEPGLRCNVGEPQPRCRQLFSLKIGCHLRADRNGIYQSIEFTNQRSYPTCKVPWRLKMCFANLAGGTGNFGSKYCTLVRTMTQQKSSWKFGHSESLKYQGWQVHTDFSSKDCTNLRGMASVLHQLSRSRLDLLFLTLRSIWVLMGCV